MSEECSAVPWLATGRGWIGKQQIGWEYANGEGVREGSYRLFQKIKFTAAGKSPLNLPS
jgi:hypothetical protein